MEFLIETELEEDGRWIADIPQLPGVLAYGGTEAEAMRRVSALAMHVVADRIDHGELAFDGASLTFKSAKAA